MSENLAKIRQRVEAACERSGRDSAEVTLVGAAKRQPDARLLQVYESGLRDFGENLVQEAVAHRQVLPENVTWHLIGPLQSNKVKKAVGQFGWIHSVDRLKIARALDREAELEGRVIQGLAEVNLGGEPTKHGFSPEALVEAAAELLELDSLRFVGLMAIPPQATTDSDARKWFCELRDLRDQIFSSQMRESPGYLSMGMSGDFESAIEEGATHVRIGSALFGPRDMKPRETPIGS